MKINVKNFTTALKALQSGLGSKDIIEQATHFIFSKNIIMTYNDNICMVYPFDGIDIECSVQAEKFFKIVSTLKDKEVELSLEDEVLKLKGKTKQAALAISTDTKILDIIEDLKIPEQKSKKWKKLPENFIRGLRLCSFSISSDMTNPQFNCAFIDGNEIVAAETERISVFEMTGEMESFFLPKTGVNELVKFSPIKYYLTKGWVYFINDEGVVFCARITEGSEYENTDPREYFKFKKRPAIKFPDNLKEIIESTSIFETDGEKEIKIRLEKGKMKCSNQNEEGWVNDEVKIDYTKNPIEFLTNPILLSEIISKTPSMAISFDTTRALFKTDNFQHLLCLYSEE